MTWFIRGSCAWVVWVLLAASFPGIETAHGQPLLEITHVIRNGDSIAVHFREACVGRSSYLYDPSFFTVFENGVKMEEFAVRRTDPHSRQPQSVSLVIDNSGSMSGSPMNAAKDACLAFVDQMDGVSDQTAIVLAESPAWVNLSMSTNRDLLRVVLRGLFGLGGTALWDAMHLGLQELTTKANNRCRGMIVLSDGRDANSTLSMMDVLALAVQHDIRVYTIGLGESYDEMTLRTVAEQTGARFYYSPSGADLIPIYEEIAATIRAGSAEHVIEYQSRCMDGTVRTVDLHMHSYCGGSVTKSTSYQAADDSTTFLPSVISVDRKVCSANTTVTVPIRLDVPHVTDMIHPASFTLLFDENFLQLQGVSTDGTLLDGVPVTVVQTVGGVRITSGGIRRAGAGILLSVTFRVGAIQGGDTVHCPIELENWVFASGCFRPVLAAGGLDIVTERPMLVGVLSAPQALTWSVSAGSYAPDPVHIEMRVTNFGAATAMDALYTIACDTTALEFVSPDTTRQRGNMRDIAPNSTGLAAWDLRARPRATSDSVEVCITASFANHPEVRMCRRIWIPSSRTVLACVQTVPAIVPIEVEERYDPMPFEVIVEVRNDGAVASDTIRMRMQLPGSLVFAGSDSAGAEDKLLSPPVLPPGTRGYVTWHLSHPGVQMHRELLITSTMLHGGVVEGSCTGAVVVPALLPPLVASMTYSGETTFCEGGYVVLDAGPGYTSYAWSSGERNRSIVARTTGSYAVRVMDAFGRGALSPPLAVTVYPVPRPHVEIRNGRADLCLGDSIDLDAGGGYAAYLWSNGATTRVLRVGQSGQWWSRITTEDGCLAMTDTLQTRAWPKPPVPTIRRDFGRLLGSIGGHRVQWYRDGVPLPDGTANSYVPKVSGSYTYEVTNEHGCSSMSPPFIMTILSRDDVSPPGSLSVTCLPNPASDEVEVCIDGVIGGRVTLTLVDALGRVWSVARDLAGGAHMSHRFSVRALPPGVYFIIAATRDAVQLRKFVKVE